MRGSRQGLVVRVSEQRAHSIGSATAVALVAPLVRVLSSAISSTIRKFACYVGKDTHGKFGKVAWGSKSSDGQRRLSCRSFV